MTDTPECGTIVSNSQSCSNRLATNSILPRQTVQRMRRNILSEQAVNHLARIFSLGNQTSHKRVPEAYRYTLSLIEAYASSIAASVHLAKPLRRKGAPVGQ